jgi:hypothetical protein
MKKGWAHDAYKWSDMTILLFIQQHSRLQCKYSDGVP